MRNFLKLKGILLLLVLIFISANNGLRASHIIGAEISYKQIEGSLYHFTLKVYRDCNECKFNSKGGGSNLSTCPEVPNLKVKGALNSAYSESFFDEIVMTRTKIEDQTPTCYASISKCKNGSTLNYGFELQEFEGTFNFNNLLISGKCEFDISIAISSRNSSINSLGEQNFFNYSYINLCSNVNSQSTRFDLPPVYTLLQNQTHNIALGVVNADNDSLSFKLKPALINRKQSVVYNTGRTFTTPYAVYCSSGAGCPPNPNAVIAEGFYFSNLTGDIIFTPTMLNEGGVIIVECEEWKKDNNGITYLAGITRRDIYAEVIVANNNLPKIKNNELILDLCEGEEFNYQISLEDLKLFGVVSDSVQVNIVSDLPDLSLIKNNLSLPPYCFYNIKLTNSNHKGGIHYITINSIDNNCPLRGISSKTIVLNILKKRKIDYTYKTKNCGLLQIETKLKNSDIRWILYDENNVELKRQIGAGFTYQLLNGGKFILKATLDAIDNLCAVNILDTIFIKDFNKPDFEIGPNLLVCKNTLLSVAPTTFKTFDSYKILVDNVEVLFPYSFKAITNKKILFKVLQNDGCSSEDVLVVNVQSELERSFLKDTICSNLQGLIDIDKTIIADRTKLADIDITTSNIEVTLNKVNNLNWNYSIVIPENRKLNFTSILTDNNGCLSLDTFTVVMINPQPIKIGLAEKICSNVKNLKLPIGLNGNWECINDPGSIINNILNIQPSFTKFIELKYTESNQCINSKLYSISILDTSAITLITNSKLELCENAAPILLQATPASGKWLGSFVNQNTFYPASARNTSNLIDYKYTNSEGCISQNKIRINVSALPSLSVESNKPVICEGEKLVLKATTDSVDLKGIWLSNGSGQFDQPSSSLATYVPSFMDIQKGLIGFTYTINSNTICGNISEGLEITIKETPKGKINSDYSLNKCEPADFKFQTNYTNVTKQDWYINDTLMEEFEYAFDLNVVLKAGIYRIKTVVMNGTCEATDNSEPIEIYSRPVSDFIANPNVRISREYPRLYLKDITTNRNPFSSKWYFNNVLIDESKEFYYNIETSDDKFSIKLVNISVLGACENSITKEFVFTPINQLYIPDAFSPDAKGPDENNEFTVRGQPMQFFYIEIFDKWGGMLYTSKDMNAGWDGTSGGKIVKSGVYFYKINSTDLEGISRDYSGTVTLIR